MKTGGGKNRSTDERNGRNTLIKGKEGPYGTLPWIGVRRFLLPQGLEKEFQMEPGGPKTKSLKDEKKGRVANGTSKTKTEKCQCKARKDRPYHTKNRQGKESVGGKIKELLKGPNGEYPRRREISTATGRNIKKKRKLQEAQARRPRRGGGKKKVLYK